MTCDKKSIIASFIAFGMTALLSAAGCGGAGTAGDGETDAPGDQPPDGLDAASCEGVTCSGHGTCIEESAGPFCLCQDRYAGVDCSLCAEGYAFDENGECQPSCAMDCGAYGRCVVLEGRFVCACDPGHDGERCEIFSGSALEIYALDIWGQGLDGAETAMAVTASGRPLAPSVPVAHFQPGEAGPVTIHLESDSFHPFDVTLAYDATNTQSAFVVTDFPNPHGHALSISRDNAGGLWTHTIYIGLRHRWFSAAGAPARKGNRITFLMDGQEAYAEVAQQLRAAYDTVLVSTWWWESTFELVRGVTVDDIYRTPEERWPDTILGMLEGLPGVMKRVLVNQFVSQDGILEDFNVDDLLLEKGAQAGDNFEFMGQVNPTGGAFEFQVESFWFGDRVRASWPETAGRTFDAEQPVASPAPGHSVDITLPLGIEGISVASYHQKFIVLGGLESFVGGMNLRITDWDTSEHLVFDPRRMPYEATVEERESVLRREADPASGPRKDMMFHIDGPLTQDVAEVFKVRWDYILSQGVRFSENAGPFDIRTDVPGYPDGIQAQLTVTMPEPFWRHSTLETWFNAIAAAERYIYIEDQYFRAPMLSDLIVQRMNEVPGLVLIVVTKPISEWTDPGCYWTHVTDALLDASFPGRYFLYQLRSFDYVDVGWGIDETAGRIVDIDTHSKCLMVDDVFMSAGSTNHNNRGLVYEGEMNVAVLDGDFVREARRRIFENILGSTSIDSDDMAVVTGCFQQAAAWNQQVWDSWEAESWDLNLDGAPIPDEYRPVGLLYPLDFATPGDCLIEDISPDLTVM